MSKIVIGELMVYIPVNEDDIQQHLESCKDGALDCECETEEDAAKCLAHDQLNIKGGSLKDWSYSIHRDSKTVL